ncbi:Zn-ribbon domain-containing OB-fold protein [Hydrogenophaga sp.]|uniref:Zn-ribbon domain-containing OB-fold protein n=1 Tax=Hydrogenophaga sp. TaxID=1904254 RepID=UPI002FC8833B
MASTDLASGGILARHQAALNAGHFLIQRCRACHEHVYFPREVCPHCGSDTLDLVAPGGAGTVHAVTTVRRKAEAGGDYNVCIVELDEGVRLMSRVEGVTPDAVRIGQRVRARVARVGEQGLVVFDLEAGKA